MFDNLSPQNQPNNNNQNPWPAQPQRSDSFNSPQGSQAAPAYPSTLPGNGQAEDIYAGFDSMGNGNPNKPAVFQPKAADAGGETPMEYESGNNMKRYMYFGIGVIVILVLFMAGYTILGSYIKNKQAQINTPDISNNQVGQNNISSTNASQNSPAANNITPSNEAAASPVPTSSAPVSGTAVNNSANQNVAPSNLDSDQDGLTDEEEKKLGTNPFSSDSDQDGLSDRDEVKVYHTDPLKADTDGDGFSDGSEVKNGYNPLGTGKLFDVNKTAPK